MADSYGLLPLPPSAPATGVAVTDPALSLVGSYFQAILNTHAQAAWNAVCPPISGLAVQSGGTNEVPVCKSVFTHDPDEEAFNERDLPALYLWRSQGEQPTWQAEDYRITPDTWTALWIVAPAQQASRRIRRPFWNGIYKLLDRAIEAQRDPAFFWADDTDPLAPTVDAVADAIKLSFSAPLVDTTYSGASLDGTTGARLFATPQVPTVGVAGSASTCTVVFTGLGADGEPRTSRVELGPSIRFNSGDWTLTQVTSVEVPAQPAGVTLTIGLLGWAGLGTNVVVAGVFHRLELIRWAQRIVTIKMGDNSPPRSYEALELSLRVEERWVRDHGDDAPSAAIQFTATSDNSEVLSSAVFP